MPGRTARMVLTALRGYKILFSPLFAGSCRFTPSCADYTAEAVRLHGAWTGLVLGMKRLLRCRPFGPWGFDPVPRPAGAGTPREAAEPRAAEHSCVTLRHAPGHPEQRRGVKVQ